MPSLHHSLVLISLISFLHGSHSHLSSWSMLMQKLPHFCCRNGPVLSRGLWRHQPPSHRVRSLLLESSSPPISRFSGTEHRRKVLLFYFPMISLFFFFKGGVFLLGCSFLWASFWGRRPAHFLSLGPCSGRFSTLFILMFTPILSSFLFFC